MASKTKNSEIRTVGELFLGQPSKYEWVRADKKFHDIFKSKVIRDPKLREKLQKYTGEKFYPTWQDLTEDLADKQLRNKIL